MIDGPRVVPSFKVLTHLFFRMLRCHAFPIGLLLLSRAMLLCVFYFFFSSRRRHTRFDCDWSSDVCSSDLERRARASAGTSSWARATFVSSYSSRVKSVCSLMYFFLPVSAFSCPAPYRFPDRKSVV